MARSTVRVEGLRDLDAALGELPKSTAKSVLRRTAKKALEPFDRAWRANAPFEEGHLRESGGISQKLTRRQATLNRRTEGKDFIEMYAGPNDVAAVLQEFGTSEHAPQPFVRPAWDSTRHQILDIVSKELGGEIDRAAKRLARKTARLAARAAG